MNTKTAQHTPHMTKVNAWEAAWTNYVDKLARLDDLKAQGRYGYQLRMPRLAVQRAYEAVQVFA
jgi:hypothetical protein